VNEYTEKLTQAKHTESRLTL